MASQYRLVCIALGAVLGWLPWLVHGPIPEKFNVLYIKGAIAVWAFYTTRMMIGFWVGMTIWPRAWYWRGPLIGFVVMFPLTLISLATPGCGPPCMALNLTTATTVGFLVAGGAFAITGKHHAADR